MVSNRSTSVSLLYVIRGRRIRLGGRLHVPQEEWAGQIGLLGTLVIDRRNAGETMLPSNVRAMDEQGDRLT